tara:strand:+ start:44125 stop:45537 length:1413 start_codon:yes stop_codon:yes gene_type:complete
MLFNSIDFAIFLPIVFILYWLVSAKKINYRNGILLIASYIFYAWWDWRFLGLIIFSSIVDFMIGKKIEATSHKKNKKQFLLLSVFVNLGALFFFKYFNFFIESFTSVFTLFGTSFSGERLNIILPVGISFYTFQTLSYTIDIYRGKIKATHNYLSFFTFVSFFPQLVAGPIERASNLLPQFSKSKFFKSEMISKGFKYMIYGFFLKLVVADRAAIYVNAVYNNVENHDGFSFIAATILFAFQIYGDFAGYSLIAIGTAKLFGFDLMTNFRRPYFSSSIGEFWSRWHISLSTWFRDYVYIPLGGNRVSKSRWFINIFITFLLSGIWHGANWTFVVWGALNGAYLVLETFFLKKKNNNNILNILLTFFLINVSWIFFRSNSIEHALQIIHKILFSPGQLYIGEGDDITALIYSLLAISLLLLIEVKKEFFNTLFTMSNNKHEVVRLLTFSVLIFIILYLGVFDNNQFIYFQF